MPIIKSAKKRVKTAQKAAVRNSKTKRSLKTAVKAFHKAVLGKKVTDEHNKAQSALDKAAKKGLVHKNKVARQKKQLAAKAKTAGTGVATKKATTATKKAATVKKTDAKKPAVAKKPATKKAPAKKPAAKK